jgi:2-C-methyl-D-erythritol 4-phosphate cytidylyltransferase
VDATVILVAAGPGTRLAAGGPKAFVSIGGTAIVVHAARSVSAPEGVTEVVVVCPPGMLERTAALISSNGPWRCPIHLVEGGAERQDSVRCGLERAGAADLVAIHDAARPFVPSDVIARALDAAARDGAALVAVPCTDTVKRVSEDGVVEETLPRDRIWLAQTPQAFRAPVIRDAHARARAAGIVATDDAALVERLGLPVRIVPGSAENRKITTAADLRWAEWFLSTREPR